MATHKTMSNCTLSDWGCKIENDSASPIWGTLPEAYEACSELLRCGCKLKCSNRCKYAERIIYGAQIYAAVMLNAMNSTFIDFNFNNMFLVQKILI